MVSYLVIRDGGLDLSRVTGGYVDCLSTSNCGSRFGDGGRTVDAKARGDAGLVFPLDVGLEPGGDSRSRGGNFGDGARCEGELGREGAREVLM